MTRRLSGREGVAMVIVLVLLLALTAMVVGSLDFATERAVETASLPVEYQADFMAEGALEQARRLLMADETPYSDSMDDEWAEPWHDGNLTIRITPCNAYINIAQDSERLMDALDELLDTRDDQEREDMIEHFQEWMERPTGLGEKEHRRYMYVEKMPSYFPTNATLERPGELRLVAGWEDVNATWIDEHFTVWGDQKININFAPPDVIAAYLPTLEDHILNIVYWRSQDEGFKDVSQILSVTNLNADSEDYEDSLDHMTVSSQYFRVDVIVDTPGCVLEKRYILKRNPLSTESTPKLVAQETMRVRLPGLE